MSDLEESFQELDCDFQKFYQSDELSEFAESSYPILESLKSSSKHYSDEEFIAQGGEKKIFKVKDTQADRFIALARPLDSAEPQQIESFLREARISSFLQHPNILSVYEMSLDQEGEPFFTMELMKGESLLSILNKIKDNDAQSIEKYPLPKRIDIFQKICSALSYAHSKNILHLDIKPANIQVGEHGEVLLCDWGLAKIMKNFEKQNSQAIDLAKISPDPLLLNEHTLVGQIKGTPGFMSPEQINHQEELSPASDIYALGSLLYSLLTHKNAFDGSHQDILTRTLEAPPLAPSVKCSHKVPRALEAICLKAMSLKPTDRYAQLADLEKDLELYQQGYPVKAQKARLSLYLSSWFKRHKKTVGLSSFFLLLISAIIFLSFKEIQEERNEAISEKVRAEENLRLFRQEQAIAEKNRQLYEQENNLNTVQADYFFETINNLYELDNYTDATKRIKAINKHLEREKDPKRLEKIFAYKAGLYFVLQDYPQCLETLKKIDISKYGKLKSLYDISHNFAPRLNKSSRLSGEDLEQLALRFPNHITSMLYYTYYYHTMMGPRKPEENLKIVKVLLNRINLLTSKTDRPITLKKSLDASYQLDLSHHKYSHLAMPIPVNRRQRNLLLGLNVNKLDLSYSKFNDGTQLIGYNLDELHIRGIHKVNNLRLLTTGKIKIIYHNLELSDQELAKLYPKTQFLRSQD